MFRIGRIAMLSSYYIRKTLFITRKMKRVLSGSEGGQRQAEVLVEDGDVGGILIGEKGEDRFLGEKFS
jgi:hypothetical protein